MKKFYESLRLSVVTLATTDIICSSSVLDESEETRYDVGGQWNQSWFK